MPDRSGALGQVATAIGSVGADISAIEIVERAHDRVIDDFLLDLPRQILPEELVAACLGVAEVQVVWLSRYADLRDIGSDLEIVNHIGDDREHATALLLSLLPAVFHSRWAALIDVKSRQVLLRSEDAPDLNTEQVAALEPFDQVHFTEMSQDWLPDWGPTALAVVPDSHNRLLILARSGGPDFLESELFRLYHLIRLADSTANG